MSILTQNKQVNRSPVERVARQLLQSTSSLAHQIIVDWERNFDSIYNSPRATPAEVLKELGTDAAEVFDLSTETVKFLGGILPGRLGDEWARIQKKLATRPATTVHDDGTVTLTKEPAE